MSISSHVAISGNCEIYPDLLEVNCTIKDFTYIGKDCFITMGAIVKNNLEEGSTIIAENSKILFKKMIQSTTKNKIFQSL